MRSLSSQGTARPNSVANALTRIHTFAVLLIAGVFLLGGYQMDKALQRNTDDRNIVNVTGTQLALAHRIAFLSNTLADSDPEQAVLIRASLGQAQNKMRGAHAFLTRSLDGEVAPAYRTGGLVQLYGKNGKDLDRRVDAFLDQAAALQRGAIDVEQANGRINIEAFNALLDDLYQALELQKSFTVTRIRGAEGVLKRSILTGLVVLFGVAIFVFRPITKRASGILRSSEKALQERTDILSRSLAIAGMGYWYKEVDRPDRVWLSRELAQLYNVGAADQWLSVPEVMEIGQDENGPALRKASRECQLTGKSQYVENRIILRDGTAIHTATSMTAQRDEDGAISSITGVVRDITADVEARSTITATVERLESSGEALREAQVLGQIAMWHMPIGSQHLIVDDSARSLLRLKNQVGDPLESDVAPITDLDIRYFCLEDSFEHLMHKVSEVEATGINTRVDIKVRRGDGSIADWAVRIKLRLDEDGSPSALFGTFQDITEAKQAERQLEKLAFYDHVTGLPNRALYMRRLEAASTAVQSNTANPQAVVLIDLDNFKEINDGLGHHAGDQFLAEIGRRLTHVAGPQNLVARLGGDEFAVLLTDNVSHEKVSTLVNEMLASISRPVSLADAEALGGGSGGVAILPDDTVLSSEALRFADLALYKAKETGKQKVCFFNADMSDQLQARLSLSRDLRSAISNQELETHFQPIVSGTTHRVTAFETLMRWRHETKGWIAPSDFIPIAESSHLIGEIGAFAIQDACSKARAINQSAEGHIEVAVNVSAAQLWHGDLEQMIDRALEESGLNPNLLCIELTESVFVGDSMDRVEAFLKRLKNRGVQLALDDFGTGYSSLGYLNHLPFDKLKIDRSFVAGVDVSEKRFQVLEGIIGLARGLNMKVVAEGVETASELRAVQSLGCDSIQGFFFGQPAPINDALNAIDAINAKASREVAGGIERELRSLHAVSKTDLAKALKKGVA